MPSPFPGMDPYLENTDLWQGFHNSLLLYARDALQPLLQPSYAAILDVRIYIQPDAPLGGDRTRTPVPDLEVVRVGPSPGWGKAASGQPSEQGGHWIDADPVEQREAFILIRSVPAGELITSIELLSPSNKRPGEGHNLYRQKQTELYRAGVNLVEIDLLRGGRHTVLPPEDRLAELRPFHYLAAIYRGGRPFKYQVFPWTVRDPLPKIPVPLAEGDPELELDLPELFTRAYDAGVFRRLLDYRGDPSPPLAGHDREWADTLLREAGLRSDPPA